MDDVAEIAAVPGAPPRFRNGMLPEMLHEFGGLGERAAAGDVNVVTQNTPRLCCDAVVAPNPLPNCCGAVVKRGFTKNGCGLASRARRCQKHAMESRSKYAQAGGSILAISIIAGTVAGIIVGQPSIGFLVGLGVGLALSILIWLFDLIR